ncbi:hypothetical protein HK097_011327 [Rhizophlyctis rosea]|uniref:Nucleoporin Nup54 alpha-helical domain-containing protein n=1 Tax=Rhizophlyctis rosea TaxID=64517 RepID=A0AAD5SJZ8_9FUNG|nr:hypothetical protein HK097_011327 [Rhizophlyctis rosea]
MFGNNPSAFGGGSTFGQPRPAAAGTTFGGFGTPASTQAPATGGFGGFGTTPAASQAPASGFGGFGAPAQTGATTGFGGFGTPASTQQPSAFGGFGQTPAAAPSGLFGSTATTQSSVFGAPKPTTTAFGGFGGQTQQQTQGTGAFGFGSTTQADGGGFLGQQQPAFGQQQPGAFGQSTAIAQPQQPTVVDMLKHAHSAWDPNSPNYHFKHYFYNVVHPDEVQFYKPPPGQDDDLYRQAMRDNPDPRCMVPVLAKGFEDVKKRMAYQERQCQDHTDRLQELSREVTRIRNKHYVETLRSIDRAKFKHREIVEKTLKLYRQIQLLRQRGYSIRADEENLKSRLEGMQRELQKPSMFRGRLNEVQAVVNQMRDAQKVAGGSGVQEGWAVADERSLELIYEALGGHQAGLAHLTDIVRSDQADVDAMRRKYEERPHAKS